MDNIKQFLTRYGFQIPDGAKIDYITFGGPTDLWGQPWTVDDINRTDFGKAVPSSCLPLPEPIIVSASK